MVTLSRVLKSATAILLLLACSCCSSVVSIGGSHTWPLKRKYPDGPYNLLIKSQRVAKKSKFSKEVKVIVSGVIMGPWEKEKLYSFREEIFAGQVSLMDALYGIGVKWNENGDLVFYSKIEGVSVDLIHRRIGPETWVGVRN